MNWGTPVTPTRTDRSGRRLTTPPNTFTPPPRLTREGELQPPPRAPTVRLIPGTPIKRRLREAARGSRRAGAPLGDAAAIAWGNAVPYRQRIADSLTNRATEEEKIIQRRIQFGDEATEASIRQLALNALQPARPYGPGVFVEPCIYEWFCKNWCICSPNPYNQSPYPGGILTQPEQEDVNHKEGSGVLRLDTYTCGGQGLQGTLVTETVEHSAPPDGHVSQHIPIPLLIWKADTATETRWMYEKTIEYLQEQAIMILETETYIVGEPPEAGADAAADTRRLGHRGWMIAPCKQRYFTAGAIDNYLMYQEGEVDWTWAANGEEVRVEAGQPGHNSSRRNMQDTFLNKGDDHYVRLKMLRERGIDERAIENDAAEHLLRLWRDNGGPRYLCLGPEILDSKNTQTLNVIEPQRAWGHRVEANDPRAPIYEVNWAQMRNLRGLFIDIWDARYRFTHMGLSDRLENATRDCYTEFETFMRNTVTHIVAEWQTIEAPGHPGLDYLVVAGLRTNVENKWREDVPVAANAPAGTGINGLFWRGAEPQTFTELYPDPKVQWAIEDVENRDGEPQTDRPNWIRIFKPLMNPAGGKICLLDCDQDRGWIQTQNGDPHDQWGRVGISPFSVS